MSLSIGDDEDEGVDRNNSEGSYQRVLSSSFAAGGDIPDAKGASRTLRNFILMALLFSANHGCVVSCLALASARLGAAGAWQSGILMMAYAASSLLGATYAVKTLGARNALMLGMGSYCFYVGCFYIATLLGDDKDDLKVAAAYLGAAIGGVGAGFLWTAQGTYFGLASQEYSSLLRTPVEESNAKLAGYFAFWYLFEELVMRMLSSVLLEFDIASWGTIFGIYTLVAVGSTLAMPCVYDYPKTEDEGDDDSSAAFLRKATVAAKLLRDDPKMKHMIGLNAVFGFVAAFLNSYVNGQVLPVALDDPDSKYVGILTSTVSVVAAAMSLVFGKLGSSRSGSSGGTNNGFILILGALCFGGVVLPFVVQPDASHYGWASLLVVYSLHGTGRATFEGALRSTFADYFSYEKEGAFANIILQNGIASGIGYILTFALACEMPSKYCIEYSNGTLHDVWTFEFIALLSVVAAIGGYIRASHLHRNSNSNAHISASEEHADGNEDHPLRRNDDGVST